MMLSSGSNIILFDGSCNLCNAIVRFIIKRDKSALFRFASLQSETGQALLNQYTEKQAIETLFYIRDDQCFQQSTAILYILKDLRKGWQLFYPLIFIPACIRDRIYQFISRNRYKIFGKRQTCMVPTRDIKDRFL